MLRRWRPDHCLQIDLQATRPVANRLTLQQICGDDNAGRPNIVLALHRRRTHRSSRWQLSNKNFPESAVSAAMHARLTESLDGSDDITRRHKLLLMRDEFPALRGLGFFEAPTGGCTSCSNAQTGA